MSAKRGKPLGRKARKRNARQARVAARETSWVRGYERAQSRALGSTYRIPSHDELYADERRRERKQDRERDSRERERRAA